MNCHDYGRSASYPLSPGHTKKRLSIVPVASSRDSQLDFCSLVEFIIMSKSLGLNVSQSGKPDALGISAHNERDVAMDNVGGTGDSVPATGTILLVGA